MRWLVITCAALLVCNLSACGNKGSLKTPSQIEAQEIKKARKEAEKQKKSEAAKAQDAELQEQP